MPELSCTSSVMPLTVRMRRSPFWQRSHAAGAKGYLVYNNTLIATGFTSPEDEYHHLKSAVQLWDVGCERQVEISGPDAAKLVQFSTPRDISRLRDNQCFYIPTVDGDGGMTNDPVLLRVDEDRYWVSISDSDLLLYYKGAAAALGLDVRIYEPEVAPLAIQGPKANELADKVWGRKAADLGFFEHVRVDVHGTAMVLARSGFSMQDGFELYFEGIEGGDRLWDILMEAGRDLDVRAGTPCQAERIEGGLLSYLSDITSDMTPFEAGLARFCDMERNAGCLAWQNLLKKQEPQRVLCPLEIDGPALPGQGTFWPVFASEKPVGRISSSCRAYDFDCNAAIGLIHKDHSLVGTRLVVQTPVGKRDAEIKQTFWGRQT